MSKRTDYLNWDEYFMASALLAAQRSKDPSTQVGACIVSPSNRILSVGYNGFPYGCSDDVFPWEKSSEPLKNKHLYVCHAELNAILNNPGVQLKGSRIYVTLFPCNECCKAIIQSGISEVIYLSDKYKNREDTQASKHMMDAAGVRYHKFHRSRPQILLNFLPQEEDLPQIEEGCESDADCPCSAKGEAFCL